MARIQIDRAEQVKQFRELVARIKHTAETFDAGNPECAKDLAVQLRALLHDGDAKRSNSVSLLSALSLRSALQFHDSAGDISPDLDRSRPHLAFTGLVQLAIGARPRYSAPLGPPVTKRPFAEWWERPVFELPDGAAFSRKDLVMTVADQEGAHVDTSIEANYFAFSRENSMGLEVAVGGKKIDWNENPVPSAVRQIAHEVVATLEEQAGDLLKET